MSRFAIIVFLMLLPFTAISQQPSPAPRETIKKPQADTAQKQNNSKIAAPIGTSVPDKPKPISADEKHENKTAPEWWLVYLTGALVLVTGGLTIYTANLWRSTKLLAKEAKDTSDRQADEMKKSINIARASYDVMKENVYLARQEFIATHRPRLIVRSISVRTHDNPLFGLENGKPLQFEWCVVNTGDSPCEIIESSINTSWDTTPFDTRTLYFDQPMMNGKRILPGAFEPFKFTSDIVFDGRPVKTDLQTEKKAIYFYGFIKYRDDISTVRYTAFCRSYDPIAKRFIAIDNPDCEYAD